MCSSPGPTRCANEAAQRDRRLGLVTLILKHASASPSSGEWNDDDYDVLATGVVVGRIFKAKAAPVGTLWMWTLGFGYHENHTRTHGYEATREAAMAAFAKSWRRERNLAIQSRVTVRPICHCGRTGIHRPGSCSVRDAAPRSWWMTQFSIAV
jgi:hypothetical protein